MFAIVSALLHLYMANWHSSGNWQFKQPVVVGKNPIESENTRLLRYFPESSAA
jgi:hypothetical protein